MKNINKIFTIISFILIPIILYYGVMLIGNNHPDFEGVPKYIIKWNIILLASYILILLNFLLKKKYIMSVIMIIIFLYSLIVFIHKYDVYRHPENYSLKEYTPSDFLNSEILNQNDSSKNIYKYNPNDPYPSPVVDSVNMINTRGEVVDKWINGTFKIKGGNKTFEYREKISHNYESVIDNCVKLNCQTVYFGDETYIEVGPENMSAIYNDIDNPAIGKITKIDFYSKGKKVSSYPSPHDITDSVTYTILYSQNGKSGQIITYSEDLCRGTKGGGQYCYEPHYRVGAIAIFLNKNNKSSLTASNDSNNIFFTGKLTEAQLISYQYSLIPDTGEKFPIVWR